MMYAWNHWHRITCRFPLKLESKDRDMKNLAQKRTNYLNVFCTDLPVNSLWSMYVKPKPFPWNSTYKINRGLQRKCDREPWTHLWSQVQDLSGFWVILLWSRLNVNMRNLILFLYCRVFWRKHLFAQRLLSLTWSYFKDF